MNNAYAMSATFEARKNSQATLITVVFATLLGLLMFLWSWKIAEIIPIPPDQGILVELNIPEEPLPPPPVRSSSGGGGGGNPVEAPENAGIAKESPPNPGTEEDAKDVEDDPKEKESPPILKPDYPKPNAPKINENKAPVKTPPKVDPLPPAPRQPKATLGKTTMGNGPGGGVATTYDRPGGSGTGTGIGKGSGSVGGSGTGTGGGRGSGVGPQVMSGGRSIIGSYSFEGDLDKATIYAEIKVSPDGVGEFQNFARGSSSTNSSYRTAIVQYLRRMRFNKTNSESTVVVRFNFRVNG
jgi:hypothetical protein